MIYNATEGLLGDAGDYASGAGLGRSNAAGNATVQVLRQAGGKLDIYAHSQGSVITLNAIQDFQSAGAKYGGTWTTYGNAIRPGALPDVQQLHLVNSNDAVSVGFGLYPNQFNNRVNPGLIILRASWSETASGFRQLLSRLRSISSSALTEESRCGQLNRWPGPPVSKIRSCVCLKPIRHLVERVRPKLLLSKVALSAVTIIHARFA